MTAERETARQGGRAVWIRGCSGQRQTNRDSYPDLPSLPQPQDLAHEHPTLHALMYRPVVGVARELPGIAEPGLEPIQAEAGSDAPCQPAPTRRGADLDAVCSVYEDPQDPQSPRHRDAAIFSIAGIEGVSL